MKKLIVYLIGAISLNGCGYYVTKDHYSCDSEKKLDFSFSVCSQESETEKLTIFIRSTRSVVGDDEYSSGPYNILVNYENDTMSSNTFGRLVIVQRDSVYCQTSWELLKNSDSESRYSISNRFESINLPLDSMILIVEFSRDMNTLIKHDSIRYFHHQSKEHHLSKMFDNVMGR